VLLPGSRIPIVFASAESVERAVTMARSLRAVFRCSAWVAAWGLCAHLPSSLDAKIEAIHARGRKQA
jgi:hypothetical protein